MNTRFLILLVVFLYNFFFISAQEMIPLWEKGKMPNSKGLNLSDSVANDRLYQIGTPRIYTYLADKEINTVIEIDKQRTEDVRRIWPFLRDRRIDAYSDILKRFVD